MNTVIEHIITRRSCKSFLKESVPAEMIDQIMEAGLYAASGMGRQAPVILAVTDPMTRDRLSALNAKYDPQKRIDPFYGAPVVLSVLVPASDATGVEDGSLVIGNMMLAAHALGLGSCWIHRAKEMYADPEGEEILGAAGLDVSYIGVGNCVIGYPKMQSEQVIPRREHRIYRIGSMSS